MKKPFALRRETVGRLLGCLARGLLAALLAGARLFGGFAPFAVGAVAAAGAGWEGLAALVGALSGALLFLDFSHALRTAACCVLLFTANNAFCELRAYRRPQFLPLLTAGMTLSVEAVYAIRSGSAAEAAFCLLSVLLAALFARCLRLMLTDGAREDHPAAALMVLLGALTALSAPQLQNGFAPGRIAAVLAALLLVFGRAADEGISAALCIGLAVDLAAPDAGFLHAACYGFAALTTGLLQRGSRVRAALAFALSAALFALPLGAARGAVLLYECLAGTLAFLLLPTQALQTLRGERAEEPPEDAAPESGLRRRVNETAAALRELYDSVTRAAPPPEENPAVIYDRAAEAVCRDCALRERCWVNEYNRTYTAMSDAAAALLRRGEGTGADFPAYFVDRCIRFPSFLAAVNAELRAFLLRRQYRLRLDAAHAQAAGQYAQLSELLAQAAERPDASTGAQIPYRIALTLRPKAGERVSGDSAAAFETAAGELCLLLSDGMGSGESARRESAMAVRLLERFLRAGINAQSALRTVNSAFDLRAEASDSFTTIDLLTLSLKTGEGELYKYGAAPSYVKRGARVYRIGCSTLPAGLAADGLPPETTHVRLARGSFFVMVSDGAADTPDDAWLQRLLEEWTGESPQQLAAAILAESVEHGGTADDAGVVTLYLPDPAAGGAKEV